MEGGIRIPEGGVVSKPEEAFEIAQRIGKPVVLKIQLWATGFPIFWAISWTSAGEVATSPSGTGIPDSFKSLLL